MQWAEQQNNTLKNVDRWFKEENRKQVYRIFGYAGTGKTTLAMHFREQISGAVLYAAYTGKAASVMRKKGCEGATTIHSLIYTPIVNEKTGEVTFEFNPNSPVRDASLVIIDECSMVDEVMANDLCSFGTPILVLGDPGQLPPVNGEGYFTNCEPDDMLTDIHRQALENPLIHLSKKVREGAYLKVGTYGDSKVTNKFEPEEMNSAQQIICGKNDTRQMINDGIRKMRKFKGRFPSQGERLICLKNKTDKKSGKKKFFNGGQYEVLDIAGATNINTRLLKLNVKSLDEDIASSAKVLKYSFDKQNFMEPHWKDMAYAVDFDYAYGITCHKSQGSQWENVYVYNESNVFGEYRSRWLYTALTRPSENVIVYTK